MSGIDVEDYYQRYGPMVLRRCRQLLKEEALALDAMQDVFVNLLRKQGQLHAQGPSSLLYRMATNTCLNKIDSMARREKHHVADAETGLLERIASAENVESEVGAVNTLLRLFKRHPESSKMIAVLHLMDGMTLEEVAGHVGMSVSGVRKRLRALRSTIRELEGI